MFRLLLVTVVAISASVPVLASDEQDCFQNPEPQPRIKGCSAIIQRSPNDATAYHNRAVAYGLAGDVDSAIADYTKTIEIAPNNVTAYENRGRAYASKGDYARALADETKANEMIAKSKAQSPTGSIAKPTKPKTKAISKAAKDAPESSWWPWLWGGSAGQASGKKAKP
jgi:tetratricopeptide (TPR) repeat protein